MGDRVELLLVRIDHFADRAAYVATLRSWLEELQVASGRVISMGSDLQLLFVAASEAQNAQLVEFFRSKPIDTNSRGECCVDRFVDVLGRKLVDTCSCRGFLEMHVLNAALLHKVLVLEWQAEHKWLDEALATKRTKAFLDWKDAAKAARKERRKREGLEKQPRGSKRRRSWKTRRLKRPRRWPRWLWLRRSRRWSHPRRSRSRRRRIARRRPRSGASQRRPIE